METEVLIPTLFYLSSAQMDTIRPFFPRSRGIPRVDDQRILSGSIYVLKFGLQWKDAPKEYGPYTTLYNRSVRNKEKIFEELRRQYVDVLITDTVSLLMPEATHGGSGSYTDFAEELKKLWIIFFQATLMDSRHSPLIWGFSWLDTVRRCCGT